MSIVQLKGFEVGRPESLKRACIVTRIELDCADIILFT